MGRHSKEGDSPALTATAPSTGRHRLTTRKGPRLSLSVFFRRSRHRPHAAPRPDEFRHEGVTPAYIGTLQGINATSRDNLKPVPRPLPAPSATVTALLPQPETQAVALELPDPHLDPPHYYRLLADLSHRLIPVQSEMISRPLPGA